MVFLKQVLVDNPGFLAVWTCWEPNALDGKDADFIDAFGHDETGRYLPYWNRLHGDIDVEPLVDYTVAREMEITISQIAEIRPGGHF